jgi:hypothetical protein
VGNLTSNERTLTSLKKLVRGYVALMESARERIIFHGGTCDSVEQMERGDPYLAEAKAAIALAESAGETTTERPRGHLDLDTIREHVKTCNKQEHPCGVLLAEVEWLRESPVKAPAEFDLIGSVKLAEEIIQKVSELPDRTSPDDEPTALVCSPSELEGCIVSTLETRWEQKAGRRVLESSHVKAPAPHCTCGPSDIHMECPQHGVRSSLKTPSPLASEDAPHGTPWDKP